AVARGWLFLLFFGQAAGFVVALGVRPQMLSTWWPPRRMARAVGPPTVGALRSDFVRRGWDDPVPAARREARPVPRAVLPVVRALPMVWLIVVTPVILVLCVLTYLGEGPYRSDRLPTKRTRDRLDALCRRLCHSLGMTRPVGLAYGEERW